ncbi:MAG: hypothetical protein MJ133_00195 [Lachnospiraceae bacterium]|nr:hypothetical protein [Lachnospiraceae bacterium]
MNKLLSRLHQFQDKDIVKKAGFYAFFLAVIIEALIVVVDKSRYTNPIEGRLFQITFILCVIKILLTKFDIKEYVTIILFAILGIVVYKSSGRNEILRIFMFVAACKDMDIEKVLKFIFAITACGCAVIMILSLTGIYGEVTVLKGYAGEFVYETGDYVEKERYCFGMGNANSFHCMFFVLTLLYLYLWKDKVKAWVYGLLFALNIGLFFLTYSKMSTGLCALSIVVMFLINSKLSEKIKKGLSAFAIAISGLCAGAAVFFAAATKTVYDYDFGIDRGTFATFVGKLNFYLTGRIRTLAENSVDDGAIQSWTLLPKAGNEKYFDLGINRLFYWYGIITAVVIIAVFAMLLIYLYKKGKYTEVMFLAMIICYTLIEAHFVSVYIGRCYPLVILGGYWALMMRKDKADT